MIVQGLQTGDLVRLEMPRGKYAGTHTGRLTGDRARLYMSKGKYAGHHVGRIAGVRATGILDLKTTTHKISASAQRFSLIQKFDGYDYQWRRGR